MTDATTDRTGSLEKRLAQEPQSPLFARLAEQYLLAGRTKDALRLCDDGLALYPFYSTAHLIKGRVLVELGMLAEAKHEYEVVHELLPTNQTLARLVSSISLGPTTELTSAPSEEAPAEIPPPPEVEAQIASPGVPAVEPQAPIGEEAAPERAIEEDSFGMPVTPPEPAVEPAQVFQPVPATPEAEDAFGLPLATTTEELLPEPATTLGPSEASPAAVESFGLPPDEPAPETLAEATAHPAEALPPEQEPFGAEVAPAMTEDLPPRVSAEPVAAAAVEEPMSIDAGHENFSEELQAETLVGAHEAVTPVLPIPEPPPLEPPAPATEQTPDWMEAFGQLQEQPEAATEAPIVAPPEEENPFAVFGTEQPAETAQGESYDEFAARTRMELFGTEDTMSLEEYLAASAGSPAASEAPDKISELAEKLKTSQRITPPVINFSEKSQRSSSDGEASAGGSFVTPTLAEIYVKQGWFDDAIKAYRALAHNKPAERERFEQRITEIEELKAVRNKEGW